MRRLIVRTQIPDGFLALRSPRDILEIFQSPCLFDLEGAPGQGAIFLAALIHGNETTSFYVIQEFLRTWRPKQGPRLLIFWGNIQAAALGVRQLEDGPDFNRIWGEQNGPEFAWANELHEYVRVVSPFVGLDIHNTSGNNPLFSCISEINPKLLSLATHFAPKIFYSGRTKNVLSYSINKICPAITLECGQSSNQQGRQRALELIKKLYTDGAKYYEKNNLIINDKTVEIFECYGKFQIENSWRPIFAGPTLDESSIIINPELESYNFQTLPSGTWIARGGSSGAIQFVDINDQLVTNQFIDFQNGFWVLKKSIIPAMISDNLSIIKSDCWGYLLRPEPALLKEYA